MARIPIRMPKMSMTMTEGEVSTWVVGVGDTLAEGDVVCEVMTDKVDMEVESPAAGELVEIVHSSGTVDVGEPIGWLDGDDAGGLGDLLGDIGEPAGTTTDPSRQPEQAPAEPRPTERGRIVPAVPLARTLATRHGLDLDDITGSGPRGRVTVADVRAAAGQAESTPLPDRQAPPNPSPAAPPPVPAAAVTSPGASARGLKVRKLTAAKMSESAVVPQFTLWRDVRLDDVNAHRSCSWTVVMLQAYAAALRVVPGLLARWTDDGPEPTGPPAVGLAVDTPDGLLAPTISTPDEVPAQALDAQLRGLVAVARGGKVDPSLLTPANATLSNLGGLGVDGFQALLTPPQASALSVGSIEPRPVAVAGGLGTALTVRVGLTVDHRVADGADGARLLEAFVAAMHREGDDACPS